MIDSFDILFSKTLIKTSEINMKKQIFLGILIPIVFIIFFIISPKYTKLAFLSCVILISFASFIKENEIFLVYEDFKVFDIELNSFRFYKAYIIQRLLKDDFIMQGLSAVGILGYFLISGNFKAFLWFVIVLIAYIALMPINHVVGVKYPNMLFVKVIIDTAIVFFLVIGAVLNVSFVNMILVEGNSIKEIAIDLLFLIVYFIVLFKIGRKKTTSLATINFGNYDKTITWIKKIDMEVYKDYLINFQDFVTSLIGLVVFFYIMRDGFDFNSSIMTIMFIIVPSGMFTAKNKKKYNLTTKDNFFYSNSMSKSDLIYIRRKKLKTLCTESIVKVLICAILLAIGREFNDMRILVDVFVVAFISSLLHFIIVIRDRRFNAVCLNIIKYTLIVLPMLNSYIQINPIAYWGYFGIVGFLTIVICKIVILGELDLNEKEICMDI